MQCRHILGSQQRDYLRLLLGCECIAFQDAAQDTRVGKIQRHIRQSGQTQRGQCEGLNLTVGLEPRMTVDFGAYLQGLARRMESGGACMQHTARIAQARDRGAVEQMGVDAGDLSGHVGAQTHGAARELIHQLEHAQIHVLIRERHQGIHVFEHGWHHQFVAITPEMVEQPTAQLLYLARFGRQDIGDVLGK